ncbi:hypothetical protein LXL04_036485 [Taraxacum kok-saghyz]
MGDGFFVFSTTTQQIEYSRHAAGCLGELLGCSSAFNLPQASQITAHRKKCVVCLLIHKSQAHNPPTELEQNKAQLVIIAHDVDPIELVVWLPALCRKMEIPYCIVKGKSRLGTIVHQKTAAALCLTTVKNEDKMEFSRILEAIKANFNDKYEEYKKKWGGGIMGSKSQAKTKAKERVLAKEAAQRLT